MPTGADSSGARGAAVDPARAAVLLGAAWLERGQERLAQAHLERALALDPRHPEAHRWLAYLRVRQGDCAAALPHFELALAGTPADSPLHREAPFLRALAGSAPPPVELPAHPGGRLRFSGRWERTHHRSGWRYAMEALYPLHHRDGVRFEGFLEDPFAWQHPRAGVRPGPELLAALRNPTYEGRFSAEELGVLPYREPWVGFLHNPPRMPDWFHPQESPQAILSKAVWKASLEHCIGLFTLSEYAATWLRQATGKPVSALLHPTETPTLGFSFERFLANPRKQIVQVGWWLRRLAAIERLPLPRDNPLGYTKLRLLPEFFPGAPAYLRGLIADEHRREGWPEPAAADNVQDRRHIPNADYDALLAENICFVSLYDASANNAVVECLVRGTPLLVNRLPAVEEYLGAGYPLYFRDLDEAAAMALDLGRLRAAHDWLLDCPTRHHLDQASFRRDFKASEVYRLL